MGRSRTIGAIIATFACAGLVAGCGSSGGYTASEDPPATGTPTEAPAASTGTAAAGAGDATKAVGALAPRDPSLVIASFKGYERFPKDRAGKIFVDPTVKAEAPAPTPAAPGSETGTTGGGATTPATTDPTTSTPTTSTPVTMVFEATLDISGVSEKARVGSAVPAASPQFTVQGITTSTVTLKINSGTLPGGGSTIDIDKGQSVSLSNPTDGSSYAIKVVDIAQVSSGS